MKVKVNRIKYEKEFDKQYGTMYLFKIYYTDEADNSKIGSYVTLNRDQQKFKIDEYIDITEEVKTFTTRNGNREWQELMIKPVFIENNNNEGRNRPTN